MANLHPLRKQDFVPGEQSLSARELNELRNAVLQEITGVDGQILVKKYNRRLVVGLAEDILAGSLGSRGKNLKATCYFLDPNNWAVAGPVTHFGGTPGSSDWGAAIIPYGFTDPQQKKQPIITPGNNLVLVTCAMRSYQAGSFNHDIWAFPLCNGMTPGLGPGSPVGFTAGIDDWVIAASGWPSGLGLDSFYTSNFSVAQFINYPLTSQTAEHYGLGILLPPQDPAFETSPDSVMIAFYPQSLTVIHF